MRKKDYEIGNTYDCGLKKKKNMHSFLMISATCKCFDGL